MLNSYGWSLALQDAFAPFAAQGLFPARVVAQHRSSYRLVTADGECDGVLSGRFAHEAAEGDYPVTGDWVPVTPPAGDGPAVIHNLMPRTTVFTRRAAGSGGGGQVVAANVDVALLAASLNADLNPRRLERYLATASESGVASVVVLTKADLVDDAEALTATVEAVAGGVPVIAISVRTGQGLDALKTHLAPGRTAVLLGSSGVGKSSVVNALAGERLMATQSIREADARGRHTTSHRELIRLPSGALILDTPGMRELGMWEADEGIAATFPDIEALAAACRFSNCTHATEPGCAVQGALASGELDAGRWAGFQKLQSELAHEHRKEDPRARAASRKDWAAKTRAGKTRSKAKRVIDED